VKVRTLCILCNNWCLFRLVSLTPVWFGVAFYTVWVEFPHPDRQTVYILIEIDRVLVIESIITIKWEHSDRMCWQIFLLYRMLNSSMSLFSVVLRQTLQDSIWHTVTRMTMNSNLVIKKDQLFICYFLRPEKKVAFLLKINSIMIKPLNQKKTFW